MKWCQHQIHVHRQLKKNTNWFFLNISIFYKVEPLLKTSTCVFLNTYAYTLIIPIIRNMIISQPFPSSAVTHTLVTYLPVGLFRVEDLYALTRPTQI